MAIFPSALSASVRTRDDSPLRPHAASGQPRFPWRAGNRFRLLINGTRFFPEMFAAIATARQAIRMEMYLMESGRVATTLVQRLVAAVERGVRVQLLLDGFGSFDFFENDRRRLTEAGVELVFYNPLRLLRLEQNLFRTHRKMLLVDDALAFVGGTGIADTFTGEQAWRETMVAIQGPVVGDWITLFQRDWTRWSNSRESPSETVPKPWPDGLNGRVTCNRGEDRAGIKRALLARMRQAHRNIWLATAYFVPSRKFRRALRRKARRGLDVRVLLPGPITDHPGVRHASQRYYARLLRHGVRIFEYQHRFMHTKMVLVDDWVTIGSSNLDRWNLHWNLEANQEIEGAAFASEVRRMLVEDMVSCVEIHYDNWRQRSRLQRAKEWFWGKLDLRLAQWSARGRRQRPRADDERR